MKKIVLTIVILILGGGVYMMFFNDDSVVYENEVEDVVQPQGIEDGSKDEDVADSPGTEGSDVEPVSLQGV